MCREVCTAGTFVCVSAPTEGDEQHQHDHPDEPDNAGLGHEPTPEDNVSAYYPRQNTVLLRRAYPPAPQRPLRTFWRPLRTLQCPMRS